MYYVRKVRKLFGGGSNSNSKVEPVNFNSNKKQNRQNPRSYAGEVVFTAIKFGAAAFGAGAFIYWAYQSAKNVKNVLSNDFGNNGIDKFSGNDLNPQPFNFGESPTISKFNSYENNFEEFEQYPYLDSSSTSGTSLSFEEVADENESDYEKHEKVEKLPESQNRRAIQEYIQGGNEFQVNTYTAFGQSQPSVSNLNNGKFVVVWQQSGNIYGQRYDAAGLPIDDDFRINTYTTASQEYPAVSGLNDGGFVVVWQSGVNSDAIRGQRYNAVGSPVDNEFQVNIGTGYSHRRASVSSLNDGGFVVVWVNEAYANIYGQCYDAVGLPIDNDFRINTYLAGSQENPSVSGLNDGGFVVAWSGEGQGDDYGIYGQRYNSTGFPVSGEFRINNYTPHFQMFPSVTGLSDKGFVVVWMTEIQDGHNYGIYGRVYNTEGNPLTSEFQVNTYTTSPQRYPSVSSVSGDRFVVAWESENQDGSLYGIFGQCYEATGLPLSNEFQINTYTTSYQWYPSTSGLNDGRFVVVWQSFGQDGDDDGIYGRIFTLNESPQLINNQLTINEGQTIILNSTMLNATDPDNDDNLLNFIVNNVQHGYFAKISSPQTPITAFTQQEITNNEIQFVHDRGEIAPSYEVKVSDGADETDYEPATIIFDNNINDIPVLINNKLIINEGQTVLLDNTALSAADPDNDDNLLNFTVNNVQYGQFERVNNPGTPITDFIQQEITNNTIQFVHNGSENAPFYEVKVSDGDLETTYQSAVITFTNINDMPTFVNNQLTIEKGETVIFNTGLLSAADIDNNDTSLNFTVNAVQHGRFERINNTGVPITSFIQQDIIDGNIQFIHDGGELAPYYEVKVSDGDVETSYQPANITFTNINIYTPVLENNQLTINEGQTIILDNSMLSATDLDTNAATLIFTVNNVQYGHFEETINPGVSITSFTQQEITDDKIQFVHDGGEEAPAYEVKVSDGELETAYQSANIAFANINDMPKLINNRLETNRGATITIEENMLLATDEDNDDGSLVFTARLVGYGRFENIDAAGISIDSFTQQEIINEKIRFVHDGSENAPSYEISVSDGELEAPFYPANITFHNVVNQNPPTSTNEAALIAGIIGGLICVCCVGSVVCLIITATGIYAAKKDKQARRQTKEIKLLESALDIGSVLQQYKIDDKEIEAIKNIGSGASATVYMASWGDKIVAYKTFKAIDSDDIKGFEDEAKIMLGLNHPNIVRFYGICVKKGIFGLVMEYMNMGTLKDVLKDKKDKTELLTWTFKWKIAYDIAVALNFLHGKNVAHRDIKTDNVLLHKDGNEIYARVADFGISKKRDDKSVTMAIGTYKYMAPEMVLEDKSHEVGNFPMEPVDVYALGMVYVALITGEEPYPDRQNTMSIPLQVGQGKLYHELNKNECPPTFFDLTNRCRSVEAEKRPNVAEVVDKLKGMKDQVMNFNLTDNLITEKPKDDYERKVISM